MPSPTPKPIEPPSTRRLLPLRAAAFYLAIGERTLKTLRAAGAIPVVRASPGRIAFDIRDLDRYIESRRVEVAR